MLCLLFNTHPVSLEADGTAKDTVSIVQLVKMKYFSNYAVADSDVYRERSKRTGFLTWCMECRT